MAALGEIEPESDAVRLCIGSKIVRDNRNSSCLFGKSCSTLIHICKIWGLLDFFRGVYLSLLRV